MPNYRPEAERFWEKVARGTDDECWEWLAAIKTNGYGTFSRTGRVHVGAHRWSYEKHCGPIGPGMVIDHVCHNRRCVNPNHLRAVTPEGNSENHSGPTRTNKSGHRGVYFETGTQKWVAQYRCTTDKSKSLMQRFVRLEDAVTAVVQHRNQVLTLNDLDRLP